MKYITQSPKETQLLAGFLITKFTKISPAAGRKKALVIALEGELGAGKTTFVQGLARALRVKAKIKSPTFNLLKHHKAGDMNLYHFDCYRLKGHIDLKILGIREILNNPKNIVLIEWSDRVKKILPRRHVKIHIDHISKNERKITVK